MRKKKKKKNSFDRIAKLRCELERLHLRLLRLKRFCPFVYGSLSPQLIDAEIASIEKVLLRDSEG